MPDRGTLTSIGWNRHFDGAWDAVTKTPTMASIRPARIVEQHRAHCLVFDGQQALKARTMSALFERLEAAGDGLAVGDWVGIAEDGGSSYIVEHLTRSNILQRSRGANGVQRIVANVDTALLVMGLDGDYSPNRMERYLLMVRAAGVAAVIVLTKPDRCDDPPARALEIAAVAGTAAPAMIADPRDAATRTSLAPWLASGRTLVLLGSSGVGKSTLMNTLLEDDSQRTGATREYDDKGRHTTTARTLRQLPGGACLIDTPGVRELKLGGDEEVTEDAFDDIALLAANCRFRDCRHDNEPGCAVVGTVAPERLENFRRLRSELQALAQRRLEAGMVKKRKTEKPNSR